MTGGCQRCCKEAHRHNCGAYKGRSQEEGGERISRGTQHPISDKVAAGVFGDGTLAPSMKFERICVLFKPSHGENF